MHRVFSPFSNWFLCKLVNRITINKDSLVRRCRTGEFTMPAPDADLIIDIRDQEISFVGDHKHCLCRTCFRTGSAGCFFCLYNTIILYEHNLTDLGKLLCFRNQGLQSIGWANLGTSCTIICTKTFMIVHYRLHQSCKPVLKPCRLQYPVRTG